MEPGPLATICEDLVEENISVVISPGNSKYYIPICQENLKPRVGVKFTSVSVAHEFYKAYAAACGFVVRLSSDKKADDGLVLWKYLLCNKSGVRESKPRSLGCKTTRKTLTNRCSCKAKLILQFSAGFGYIVRKFVEEHNHLPFADCHKHFVRGNREIGAFHQDFMMNCMKTKVGPTKSYRVYKEFAGSYANVGANVVEFRNFRRDVNKFLVGHGAQMVVDKFFRKREACSTYYYDYDVDADKQLSRLFWGNTVSRKSFSYFGDVVSADATYSKNRYDMVFVPFTGVDNHFKSITFAVGLLLKEDVESYIWLFDNFKKAMGREPTIILTDQDPSVIAAIESVFTEVVHRFCLWHIMFKLPVKVSTKIYNNIQFKRKFNAVVWSNELNKEEFEEAWDSVLAEFNLTGNDWLKRMFGLRNHWILAFFNDIQMGGMLRTTSRSESQNSFFSNFIGPESSLVEFMFQYGNAIDEQRNTQSKLDYESVSKEPTFISDFAIEKDCASVYTIAMFYIVQVEIYTSIYSCRPTGLRKDEKMQYYNVGSTASPDRKAYTVEYSAADGDVRCNCKKFIQIGLPCCHMFVVFNNIGLQELPNSQDFLLVKFCKFVFPQWTKAATLKPIFQLDEYVYQESLLVDEMKMLKVDLLSAFHSCLNLAQASKTKMKALLSVINNTKAEFAAVGGDDIVPCASSKRNAAIKRVFGAVPSEVQIQDPKQAKNKGTKRRIKSQKEIAMENSNKKRRVCKTCGNYGHNSRTCSGREDDA